MGVMSSGGAGERWVSLGRNGARKVREVYAVEGLPGVARRSRSWVRKRRAAVQAVSPLPLGPLPLPVTWHQHVLSIAEQSLPQCYHYRVQQKREICAHLGVPFDDVALTDVDEALTRLELASVLIVYRLPHSAAMNRILAEAQRLHVPVIYEVDDLIYRQDVTAGNPNLETLPGDLKAAVIRSSLGYQRALEGADLNLASTRALADDMSTMNGRPSFVVENGIDAMMLEIVEGLQVQPSPPDEQDGIVVTYGSGSRAHDHDFEVAAPALARWLRDTPNGVLKILGPVRVPEVLIPLSDRIERRTDVLAYGEYLRELQVSTISIAPLSDDHFNAFKSQVKYLEAALVGVPFVASPMVYGSYVEDGRTGIIARTEQDWVQALTELSADAARRRTMVEAARAHVRQWELVNRPAQQMQELLAALSGTDEDVA